MYLHKSPYSQDSFVPATLLGALVSSLPSQHITTTRVSKQAPSDCCAVAWKKAFRAHLLHGVTGKTAKIKILFTLFLESKWNKLTLLNYSYPQINTQYTGISELWSRYYLPNYDCHITWKFVRHGRLYKARAQQPGFGLPRNVCCNVLDPLAKISILK